MDESEPVSRRRFLQSAAGTTAVAGVMGNARAQESNESSSGGGGGGATETVAVGPGGNLVFEPPEVTITPGTTVEFPFESDGHNIVVEGQPEDADWQGTDGPATQLYDTGYVHTHTFEVEGTYEYVCQPHKQAGMVATIEVTTDVGGDEEVPVFPDSAKTLGVAVLAAMASTLGLAHFVMKYGGDYGME